VSTATSSGGWRRLFKQARSLIRQANIGDDWAFGGGTAMMIQIGHRESRDIDIFLSDPQLLPLLDPQKNDFEFEIQPNAYMGDGTISQRFAFGEGEIDFIVASALTSSPSIATTVEGEAIRLETIPEIITKKVFYRRALIKPRDIFDIAAACENHEASVVAALRDYPDQVTQALAAIRKLNPSFVKGTIAELAIRDEFKTTAETALERAKDILGAIQPKTTPT
jgi:hypothetical protein